MTKQNLNLINEAIDNACNGKITNALTKALTYSIISENKSLETWLQCELSGYLNTNEKFNSNPLIVPKYRQVIGNYYDYLGKSLIEHYNDANRFNFYVIRDGVSEIIHYINNGDNILEIRDNKPIFEEFSKIFKVPISCFRFPKAQLETVIQEITNVLIEKLIDLKNGSISETKEEFPFMKNSQFRFNLHPKVQGISSDYLENGHYRAAILDTFILLIESVKKKSNSQKDGSSLMDEVFSPSKPILKISDDSNEQQGILMLFKGATMYLRNSNAHKIKEWDSANEAIEWLSFASRLFFILDKTEIISTNR